MTQKRSFTIKFTMVILVAISSFWLVGYARALRPFASDAFRDRDLSFLTYPSIKIYRVAIPPTNKLSSRRIDFFSVSDGPTGEVVAESYFPCWVISLAAVGGILGGGGMLFFARRKIPDGD